MTRRKSDLGTAERAVPNSVRDEELHDARGSEPGPVPRKTAAEIVYRPPTNLDAPEPRPGYVQRWVRAQFRDGEDQLNWQSRLGEGWSPRDPKNVPDHEARFKPLNSKAGMIQVGGLVLMEIDEQIMLAKRKWINNETRRMQQSVSVDTDRASQDGRKQGAPPIKREEETHVSTGRRPPTLDQ